MAFMLTLVHSLCCTCIRAQQRWCISIGAEQGTGPLLYASTLSRGRILTHDSQRWVCLFEIDRYWFAAPMPSGAAYDAAQACLCRPTPTQADRAQLHLGFNTGVAAVDVLAPIGRGQSMLVCGPSKIGKSSLAGEMLLEAASTSTFTSAINFQLDGEHKTLGQNLVTEFGSPARTMTGKVLDLFTAVAHAEAVRDEGGHAFLVLDS
eukprot:2180779-Amphidinium_carterae.1